MRRGRFAAGLAALAALGACAVTARTQEAAPPPAEPVVLLAAGESQGNLEPCHCVQGMHGGFARRLSALDRERARGEVVVLDGGDQTGRDLHPKLLEAKTRAALDLLAHGRVAAMAVGEKDLRLGHASLKRAGEAAGVTLLAANLTAADGSRPFAATKRVTVGGRTVVIAGVLDPELGDPTGQLASGEADAAARAAFGDAPAGALRVLLFHGTRERARATLREDLPVDVVVCGHERETTRPLERHGRAWLLETVRDARALARLEVPTEGDARLETVTLDGQVPDDAWARGRIDGYYREVAGLPEPARRPIPDGGELQGSQECQTCHEAAWDTFVSTRHHESYAHVREKDPQRAGLFECVGCHVTGQGFVGGFRSVQETPHLAEVGCESCHGVGGNHVASGGGRGYGVKTGFPESWRATCVACHDASNSPKFDFRSWLEKIKHWSDR